MLPLCSQDDAFDAVLDKGTLDAMLCGQEMAENSQMMMEECFRCVGSLAQAVLARPMWWWGWGRM